MQLGAKVITEFLMTVGSNIAAWFMGLVPAMPEEAAAPVEDGAATLAQLVGSLSVWVNWPALMLLAGATMTWYFSFLALRIFRALLGHVPLVGGNG